MHRPSVILRCALAICAVAALGACKSPVVSSSGGTGTLRVAVSLPADYARPAASSRFVHPDTASFSVSVSGADMDTVTASAVLDGTDATSAVVVLDIPAGLDRTVSVSFLDAASAVLCLGSSVMDVVPGTTNTVAVSAVPMSWTAISPGDAPGLDSSVKSLYIYASDLTPGHWSARTTGDAVPISVYGPSGVALAKGTQDVVFDAAEAGKYYLVYQMPESTADTAGLARVYRVAYLSAGSTSGSAPTTAYVEDGTVVTLPGAGGLASVQDGITKRFLGWSTSSGGSVVSSVTVSAADQTLYGSWTVLGGIGPAGGWVFYDKGASDNAPVGSGTAWRYMEAAPTDGTVVAWSNIADSWAGTDQTAGVLGYGKYNTDLIIAQGATSGAAYACANLSVNGYADWFLPSAPEMDAMSDNLVENGVSNILYGEYYYYWSSTESDASTVYRYCFANSDPWPSGGGWNTSGGDKSIGHPYRPARRF